MSVHGTPDRIYLIYGDVPEDTRHSDCVEVTWCEGPVNESDVLYVRADLLVKLEAEVERLTARVTELEGDPKMALTWGDLNAALGNAQDRGLDHPQDAGTLAPMRERLRNALAALVAGRRPTVPADLVTLVVWRDAVTGRPDGIVLTDVGPGEHPGGQHWYHAGTGDVMDPQPSLWCDSVPPNADAPLTIKNVRRMCDLAWGTAISRADVTTIERLRAWLPKEEPSA